MLYERKRNQLATVQIISTVLRNKAPGRCCTRCLGNDNRESHSVTVATGFGWWRFVKERGRNRRRLKHHHRIGHRCKWWDAREPLEFRAPLRIWRDPRYYYCETLRARVFVCVSISLSLPPLFIDLLKPRALHTHSLLPSY